MLLNQLKAVGSDELIETWVTEVLESLQKIIHTVNNQVRH